MQTTGLRELRQQASALVRRAEAGERITVTISGRPVAVLGPVPARRAWRALADVPNLFTGGPDETWDEDRRDFSDELRDPFEP